jgi:hypothetical protein
VACVRSRLCPIGPTAITCTRFVETIDTQAAAEAGGSAPAGGPEFDGTFPEMFRVAADI